MKKDIKPLQGAFAELLALTGVPYKYKEPASITEREGSHRGFVAQQVETVCPEWVIQSDDSFSRVSVKGFEALVVEALRELEYEQKREVNALRREIREFRCLLAKRG